ncbi:MAG: hypothetical protein N3F66_07865 [Spirochaetes bacterium]|nr:hypothetical protein [Spirochaetota bacterium]
MHINYDHSKVLGKDIYNFRIFPYFLITIILLSCNSEVEYQYYLIVDSYYANFYGYYYINGKYEDSFEGKEDFTNEYGNTHYYYEKGLAVEGNSIKTIKVYAYKENEMASVTISLWKDSVELKSVTSGSYEGYNEDTGKYSLTVGPLYYEFSEDDDEESSDE